MGGDRLGQATECITPSPPKVGVQLTASGASTSEMEARGWLPHPYLPSLRTAGGSNDVSVNVQSHSHPLSCALSSLLTAWLSVPTDSRRAGEGKASCTPESAELRLTQASGAGLQSEGPTLFAQLKK